MAPCAVHPDAYAELAASFPGIHLFEGGPRSWISNQAVRMPASEVIDNPRFPEVWRRFFRYHTSAEYWNEMVRRFGAEMRNRYPWIEERAGRALEDWRVALRTRDTLLKGDIALDVLFVINTPVTKAGSVKPAHVDARSKLFTGLLYMREPDDPTPGGELELYGSERGVRFDKTYALPATASLARRVPYAENHFVGFVNGPLAVHGVSPRPRTHRYRRYIDFGAELPYRLFELPQASNWARLCHRITQPRGRAFSRTE